MRGVSHEDALDGVPEVLLGKGHHGSHEEGSGGDPVVHPGANFIKTFVVGLYIRTRCFADQGCQVSEMQPNHSLPKN